VRRGGADGPSPLGELLHRHAAGTERPSVIAHLVVIRHHDTAATTALCFDQGQNPLIRLLRLVSKDDRDTAMRLLARAEITGVPPIKHHIDLPDISPPRVVLLAKAH